MEREIVLSNGVRLRVRPVPPHVYLVFRGQVHAALPPEPQPPTVEFTTKAGHKERTVAPEDDPAWEQYLASHAQWEEQQRIALERANDAWNSLIRDYAVVAWQFPGGDWLQEPPADWRYPDALTRAGLSPSENLRAEYIALELLTTPRDIAALLDVIESETVLREEEIVAAEAGFRGRHKSAGKAAGGRNTPNEDTRGDGSGARVGANAGFLVRLFTRRARDDGSV